MGAASRSSDAKAIKGLTDLEKLRVAFFYRHIGPHGPKEDPLLQPEPLSKRAYGDKNGL